MFCRTGPLSAQTDFVIPGFAFFRVLFSPTFSKGVVSGPFFSGLLGNSTAVSLHRSAIVSCSSAAGAQRSCAAASIPKPLRRTSGGTQLFMPSKYAAVNCNRPCVPAELKPQHNRPRPCCSSTTMASPRRYDEEARYRRLVACRPVANWGQPISADSVSRIYLMPPPPNVFKGE